jgi:hypothetical protein
MRTIRVPRFGRLGRGEFETESWESCICRDAVASARWVLLTRTHDLWKTLPPDLQRYVLRFFVFKAIRCKCGKYVEYSKAYKREAGLALFVDFRCDEQCMNVLVYQDVVRSKCPEWCECNQCRFRHNRKTKGWILERSSQPPPK